MSALVNGGTRQLLMICICLLFFSIPVEGAEFSFHPSITVSEEYNDNVFDTSTHRVGDFITRAMPGATLKYVAPLWDWDAGYTFEYRNYARGNHSDELTHNATIRGAIKLIDEFMLVDVNDIYSRVSLDLARDVTTESPFVNQSDRNNFTVSPYFLWRLWHETTLKTGYRYINVWYRDPSGISKTDHVAFAELAYVVSPKLTLTGDYVYTHEIDSPFDFDKQDSYAGFRYEYADNSFISAQAGNTWITYVNGPRVSNVFWNANLSHVYGDIRVLLNTGIVYDEDPRGNISKVTNYSASVSKEIHRGELRFFSSYSNYNRAGVVPPTERRLAIGVSGRYEFTGNLTGTLNLSGERYSPNSIPYRFLANPTLNYALGQNLTMSFTYWHVSNFRNLDVNSPDFGPQVNRFIVELRKVF